MGLTANTAAFNVHAAVVRQRIGGVCAAPAPRGFWAGDMPRSRGLSRGRRDIVGGCVSSSWCRALPGGRAWIPRGGGRCAVARGPPRAVSRDGRGLQSPSGGIDVSAVADVLRVSVGNKI